MGDGLRPLRPRAYGLGVLYVFLTAVHTSALGALLTVAPRPWYGEYGRQAAAWHIDVLADQQLAGLLMWIPAGPSSSSLGSRCSLRGWARPNDVFASERPTRRRGQFAAFCLRRVDRMLELPRWRPGAKPRILTGGTVERGRAAIGKFGCGSCHEIPGIPGAATVATPLGGIANRHFLAGRLRNTPANMLRWIQHPQSVDPGNAMPDLGLSDQNARDVAAYLYTLR